LFDGTPSDVAAAVERVGQAKGGGFIDQAERTAFENTVAHYREMIARLDQGIDVIRNVIGDRREINAVSSAISAGGEVWASGNSVRVWVNPGLFELRPGLSLVNAPEKVGIQLDLAQRLAGQLMIEEVAAARLSLPNSLRGLLPGGRAGQVDWNSLRGGATPEEEASNRKWLQMIKMRAGALFAKRLLEGFRALSDEGAAIELPEMVMHVGAADADAVVAAKQLGFRVETGASR
jgi:hypothetical protein